MQYTRLGTSGLKVSPIALGCMSFGDPAKRIPWVLDDDAAEPIFRQAVELGMTFWDTANIYALGTSEETVGRAMRKYTHREDVVLATKLFMPMHEGPGGSGLSRKAVLEQIDASLRRLDTDYVDLYQIHRFDPETPVEETMEALHDVVKAGKVRYLGASSMYAWQFSKALHVARQNGWTPFVSMQNYYNLLYREEEREMLPLCADARIAVLPWSPLARGRLTRPWNTKTARTETDPFGKSLYAATEESDRRIVDQVAVIALARGVPPAQVALAWLLQKSVVTAPIVGTTKAQHLDDAVAALELKLSETETAQLEAAYVPHAVVGHV